MILKRHRVHIHLVSGLFFLALVLILATSIILFVRLQPVGDIGTARKGVVSEQTLVKNNTTHYPVFHDPKIDAVMETYVKGESLAFEKATEHKKDVRNHLAITYELRQFGTRTATVGFTRLESIVGEPDRISRKDVVIDLIEKREIGAKDIIQQTPTARRNLAYLLHDYFKQQTSMSLTPAQLVGLLDIQLTDITDISLSANDVIFSLNPYNPKSSEGKAFIAISRPLLKGIINDAYSVTDPNVKPVSEQSAQFRIVSQPPKGNTINPAGKLIALTFDDGPSDATPQLLDALDAYQSQATFFVLGHLASTYAATLQRMVREGNEIGNHTWNHPNLRLQNQAGLDSQILATQSAIQAATGGYTPVLVRPPYGFTNSAVKQYLASHGLKEALWNADTNDWKDRDPQVIYDRIMTDARDGQVILIHDIYPASVQAATRAIRDLKIQGYQIVTVSELYKYR